MSFKTLLNALLKTRTTFVEAADASFPKESGYISLSKSIKSYIAPESGFVYAAQGLNSGTRLFISSTNCEASIYNSQSNNVVISGGIPVAKGQTVNIDIPEDSSNFWLRFSKTVGGGLKLFSTFFKKEVDNVFA